jgi:hypothetical protein
VDDIASAAREVADEYTQADEAFGGQGATEHAERASELEGYADELESWDVPDQADYRDSEDEDEDAEQDELDESAGVDLDAWREACQSELPDCPL